jgi:BirA family transcriptional regulator, biotin operon repressor / biotin---[acetyl-CoA-carboxylase] ligase
MREHSVKLTLLEILADGQFHSGESLGDRLGISRAAISKHIKGVQEWGVDIFRVQGKGYQLAQPLNLLNQAQLQEGIESPIYLYPIIDSTNQYLLDQTSQLSSGTVCLAEYQAKGRGRRGRQWISPFGTNIYLSMYWRLEAGIAAAMGLSLVVGVAVVEALETLGICDIKLKWPNDLYHNDKKLAGILVEMSGQAGGPAHLVIGMGMNISMRQNDHQIDQPWTSLSAAMGSQTIDRNDLAKAIIKTWKRSLEEYELGGMNGIVERWNRLDNFLNRPVKLLMGPNEVIGVARGIDKHGAILLETEQGIERYVGGEISLRPVIVE